MYVKIIKIGIEEDHVHMYVSIPPVQPIPYVVKLIKWRTSKILRTDYEEYLKEYYWNKKAMWAVWYFVSTVWEITHDTIKEYVRNQWQKDIESECIWMQELK